MRSFPKCLETEPGREMGLSEAMGPLEAQLPGHKGESGEHLTYVATERTFPKWNMLSRR